MGDGEARTARRWKLTRRRIRIALAAVLLICAAGAAVWYWRTHQAPGRGLMLYGNIDIRQVNLAFNDEGRVEQMLVEEGDTVTEGQLLATLDPSRFEDAVDAAKGAVAMQRAVVTKLERGSRPQEIAQARAEVAGTEATAHDAARTAQRLRKLKDRDVESQQAYDNAHAADLAAQARLRAAREALALVVEGPRIEDIEAAKAQLRAHEADLALAQHRLHDTRLYAPDAGTVLTRIVEPGAMVLPNTPVYALALQDPVWARTYVPETNLGKIFPGMKAQVTTDSFPDRVYPGWVGFISPTAEFTPKNVESPDVRSALVYRLRVYIHNPDRTLRQGMPVTVRLEPEVGQTGEGQ